MPGPPSLLETDPELKARFIGFIRDGVPRAYAALGCGFSYDTLYGWVRRGLVPDAPEPYASFARELYEAEVELLRELVVSIRIADKERDNKALTWLLERRFPKAFGRTPHEPADPAADIERELAAVASKTEQLEAGGDGGELDEERWSVMEEWFYARPARLLELARKTGLAQAAVEEPGQGDTKT
jgi:hypothetical protein